MKLPVNINDLLTDRKVEWKRLEFKAGWNPEVTPEVRRRMCVMTGDHSRKTELNNIIKFI